MELRLLPGLQKPTVSKKEKKAQEQKEMKRRFQRDVAGYLYDLGFKTIVVSDLHKR